ncbi:hypothetical protein I4U23_031084 [Adineta vaga]|nr:hypothetical protein I4U23_031084 [Adineta vaga]
MNKSRMFVVIGLITCPFIFFCVFSPNETILNPIIKAGNELKSTEKSNFSAEWNETIVRYLKFPLDNAYGSHAIVLLAAAYATESGAILELGMGSTSTPILHCVSTEQKRFVLSADSDIRWVNHFISLYGNSTLHQMMHVDVQSQMGVEWARADIHSAATWSIVFIDHRPGPRRQFDLFGYSSRSTLVILHDTEQSALYNYGTGLRAYPYQYRFTKLKTYTDVLSSKNETLLNRIRFLLETVPDSYFSPNVTLKESS